MIYFVKKYLLKYKENILIANYNDYYEPIIYKNNIKKCIIRKILINII